MELQFRGKVGGVGGFGRVEIADVLISFIDINRCSPAFCVLAPRHAKQTGNFVTVRLCLILHVYGSCDVTKIFNPIVALVAIDMIDVMVGPSVIRVQPRQAMSLELHPVDPDACVPVTVDTPSDIAQFDPSAIYPPTELSGLRLVVQQASQGFGGGAFHFRLFRLRMAAIPNR